LLHSYLREEWSGTRYYDDFVRRWGDKVIGAGNKPSVRCAHSRQIWGSTAIRQLMTSRSHLRCIAALFFVAFFLSANAHGQSYPSKSVTVIVPQASGGGNDVVARIVAQKLSENLKQQFIVSNKVGAGGNIGAQAAAQSANDGYTLFLALSSVLLVNPSLYKQAGFDPIKDFTPIATLATAPYLLVAHPSFPAKSVKELIALAKSKPGGLSYGSAGNGTFNHLIGEMFNAQAKTEIAHIPYKGAAAALNDVLSGEIPLAFVSMPSSISFIKGGQLNPLGAATQKRIPALSHVPTIGETLPGFGADPWYGLFAPVGTPKAIVAQLYAAVVAALESRDVKNKLAQQGAEPFVNDPDQFTAMLKAQIVAWAKIVKSSGAGID
jgi:tripartite-type tricarboxylate transporter receptor subunit TctC